MMFAHCGPMRLDTKAPGKRERARKALNLPARATLPSPSSFTETPMRGSPAHEGKPKSGRAKRVLRRHKILNYHRVWTDSVLQATSRYAGVLLFEA